jgi:hypothetical protein
MTIPPVLVKVFKDNHTENEGWYIGITPSNFAKIQITLQIIVQIPSCLASLGPGNLERLQYSTLYNSQIHRHTALCVYNLSCKCGGQINALATFLLGNGYAVPK